MKEKVIAAVAFISLLAVALKVATGEIVELAKYLAVQAHDLWVFFAMVWR